MRLGLGLVIAASLLLLQSTSALVGHIIAHSHCDPGMLCSIATIGQASE